MYAGRFSVYKRSVGILFGLLGKGRTATETLEGTVSHISHHNLDTGFTVLELETTEDMLVCAVGLFADVSVGETLRVSGDYQAHARYGNQFRVQAYERVLPAHAAAIEKYLGSRVIEGIGARMAKRIVEAFGDDTLRIMEQTPERLAEVTGISKKRADEIGQAFRRLMGVRVVMASLTAYDVPPECAIRAWKRYGEMTRDLLLENPYLLCELEVGLSFETADRMARDNGIDTNAELRLCAGAEYVLRHNLDNGNVCLPEGRLASVASGLLGTDKNQLLDTLDTMAQQHRLGRAEVGSKVYYYLPAYYEAEVRIAATLWAMADNPLEGLLVDAQSAMEQFQQEQGMEYAPLQKQAILTAITNRVMVLTGGPGTGKTTAIYAVIRLLEAMGERVSLAAPTGRAAKRLSQLTEREASTIHRLLEVDFQQPDQSGIRFKRCEKNPLTANTVIIDECSMVDTLLFASLLQALRPDSRLILVGDPDQLPSVGAGNILKDLIDSDVLPTVHLRDIFRQAAESLIVTNAHAIVRGEYPELRVRDKDFFFMPATDLTAISTITADLCARRLPNAYGLSYLTDIQVICPRRVPPLGTNMLNPALQAALNPPHPDKCQFTVNGTVFREGDKVMQVRNNYDLTWVREDGEEGLGVYNGDIGFITMVDVPSRSLLIRFDDREVAYTFDMASELELAWAVTVHKSQGNEYEAVIMPLPTAGGGNFTRNLLYTAVTRAKRLLIIIGDAAMVSRMVDNHRETDRYTNLSYFLKEGIHGIH